MNIKFQHYYKITTLIILLFTLIIFLIIPEKAAAITSVAKVLSNTSSGEGASVATLWRRLINLVNGAVILVLIVVAFAQILRINVNTYGVKKILPSMIFAVVAANFSFLFCRILVDFANVVCSYFIEGSSTIQGFSTMFGTNNQNLAGLGTPSPTGNIFWYIVGQLLTIAGALIIYILAYLFFIRNYIIYFLVALSPLAMMATVLPQTKSIFNQWWSNFIKWVFMPTISLFWIYLGCSWFNSVQNSGIFLLNYVFAAVCFYLAITTPFKMGGAIMGTWGNLGKKAWGATAGNAWKATGGAAINDYKELAKLRAANWYAKQGADGSKFNPLARMARSGAARKMTLEEEKKAQGNIQDELQGRILNKKEGDRRLRDRINRNRSLGGTKVLAEAELEADYIANSKKGEAWAKGRKEYFIQLERAQNDVKRLHGEQDLAFAAGKDKWGDKNSKQYKLRQDYLEIQSIMDLQAAQIKKSTDNERLDGYVRRLDAMKQNDEVSSFRKIKSFDEQIAAAQASGDTANANELISKRDKIAARVKRELKIEDNELAARVTTADDDYKARLEFVQKDLKEKYANKQTGEIELPYSLRPAFKLSADKKEILDLNDTDTLGPAGVSRINALAAAAMADDSKGYTDKYSIAEIADLLSKGDPGSFEKKDVDNYLDGRGREVDALARAKVIDALRAFWSAKRARPGSVEAQEFSANMAKLLPKDRAEKYAEDIYKGMMDSYNLTNRNRTPEEIAADTKNLQREPAEEAKDYIARMLATQRGGKGVNPKNITTMILDRDPYIGTSTPFTSGFAGSSLGTEFTTRTNNPAVDIEKVSSDLNTAIAGAVTSQIGGISKKLKENAAKFNVSSDEIISRSYSQIQQSRRDMADGFARDIGLISKSGKMTYQDRETMLGLMTRMKGKTKDQIEEELKETFKGRYRAKGNRNISLPKSATQETIDEHSTKVEEINERKA